MKKAPLSKSALVFNLARKFLLAKTGRRLAAFLVLTLIASAFTVATLSSAKTKKKAQRASEKVLRVESPLKSSSVSNPKRYGRESERERERERDKRRNSAQDKSLSNQVRSKDRSPVKLTPKELRLQRARPFNGDVRGLPQAKPVRREKPEREAPDVNPGPMGKLTAADTGEQANAAIIERNAPAPAPLSTFIGLDFNTWGAGHPPDTVGDVGPNHFIQSVNSSVGIYDKSTGTRIAAFTLDTLMSQGNFGNLCDTDNFGDPVVVYDTFEDRWVITDFAFKLDASDNVVNPPGAFQCFAVSKSGDPVSGGWNFYSINTAGGLGDYPKFGIWPDALFMTTSMFDYAATGSFQNPRAYAFNKAQMYAGSPTVQVVSFDLPSTEFTVLPSNARLQTGTPPAGSPNYYSVVWQYTNVISVYKFKVDWNKISLSTFTGPFDSIAPTSWINAPSGVGQSGTTQTLDTLPYRLMMQNQYTNIGGVESLWNTHTVGGSATTQAAVRYYQVGVTGGTVGAAPIQAATHNPDTTVNRFVPSLAVDRAGNMAVGYSATSTSMFPAIRYAGRLATDAVNTLPQTEQTLFAGTGSQTGTNRWGDYAAMNLDPNGCTFWFTTEYMAATGGNWQTRIGSFQLPQCTTIGNGQIQGQVTASPGGAPISGATVSLGSRSTTTDANGLYSFSNLPAGTYPGMTATFPGRTTASVSTVVVSDGGITTQNFTLTAAQSSACLVDTTQSDFQNGIPTNVDLTTSSGNVVLAKPTIITQTANYTTAGVGFSSTSIAGQTFTPATGGTLQKLDVYIFCASCSGTNPNITIEARTTSAGNIVMTAGGLLASSTITGTSSASGGFLTATFTTPPTLTAGTQYGFIVKTVTTRTTGTQAIVVSDGDGLTGGRRQTCSTSTCSNSTGASNDIVFKSYILGGYSTSGNLVSGLKDANPAAGSTPTWGALSWTATTPASTNIQFQAAASNNANGPFTYVGPNGTAATFFTNGASLAQFNGNRYLRYKALFTGTSAATPTLADVTVCYTAVQLLSVSGKVTTDGTNPVSGVLMTLSGTQSATTTTDSNGNYSFGSLTAGGNFTVTPSKTDYNFTPTNRAYTNLAASQSNADFTATPVNYTISGQVTRKGNGLSGVTMTLSGSSSGTTTTDGSGNYTFTVAATGNYTITPSKTGYTFTPVNRTYNNLAGNQTAANFTANRTQVRSDFDGDGRSDVALWQPQTGNWVVLQSSTNTTTTHLDWGSAALGDKVVPGDYDGDGKTDKAIFRHSEGNWYIVKSSDNTVLLKHWGQTGDIPVPGDYDGDEITDVAVFRSSEGNWYIVNSSDGTSTLRGWGLSTDIPVQGDYDGDGKTDVAVWRGSEGSWYIIKSTGGGTVQNWGLSGDKPIPADYDGDGKTDVAIWRASEGTWHIINSGGGGTVKGWGDSTDQVVTADYDGDGKSDIAVFRPSEANWYIILSQTNTLAMPNMGTGDDVKVASAYIESLP
ncbi:MAG TPA: carboxypeptidase regulatory-like domain-containing protein [Pyrinomonadaceae bacterium]|jgi:hypothetical protein